MRQITEQASLAFAEGRDFKSGNTEVSYLEQAFSNNSLTILELH